MESWERLELIMKMEGLNKNSFSAAIGLSNNVTITRIINEHRSPSRATCEKIVKALGVSVSELFDPAKEGVIHCPNCGAKLELKKSE